MHTPSPFVEQLRGATRLAARATRNVTDIVEAMHHTIGAGPRWLGPVPGAATRLLSAPSYGAVRGVTHAVEAGLDRALAALAPMVDRSASDGGALIAALNGVVGDHLADSANPLALSMALCIDGAPVALTPAALAAAVPVGERLVILVHGSCAHAHCWDRNGHDHGRALARDLGRVPLYLRYNSGRHISTNGRELAATLEALVAAFPRPIDDLVLLCHSMGGLVARSACAVGERSGHRWRETLSALVTLGTPHHGAPLERAGSRLDALLGISRYTAPLVSLGRLRSAGITDLRYGNVLDEDWQGRDRFARGSDRRRHLPLPAGVASFTIAATTAQRTSGRLPGDGMVPVDSALGRHQDRRRTLDFPEAHRMLATGCGHLDLLDSAAVYARLRDWLGSLPADRAGAA